jgi:uncharacterized protein YndB with AHSA1/START domain
MKILLGVVAALIGVMLIVTAIGLLLPRNHTAAVDVTYAASPDAVYATLTDISRAPEWRTGLQRVEVLSSPGEPVRWRETADWGTITFVREADEPGRRLVSRIAEADGFGGTWTYELDDAGAGTRLRITERGEVSNPLFRFMSRFVFGYYHNLETVAADLGTRLGETAAVRRVNER